MLRHRPGREPEFPNLNPLLFDEMLPSEGKQNGDNKWRRATFGTHFFSLAGAFCTGMQIEVEGKEATENSRMPNLRTLLRSTNFINEPRATGTVLD